MERFQNDRNDTLLSVPLEKHALEQGRYIWLSVTHGQHALLARSSVGQHAYRTKEIKSNGNIYLNGRYCRLRLKNEAYRTKEIKSKGNIYLNGRYCRLHLKNEVYMHMWLVCCGSIPTLIINFFHSKRVICAGLKNEGNIYCFPSRVTRFITSILLATRLQNEGNKERGKYISS